MRVQIHPSWEKRLASAFTTPDFEALAHFIKKEYSAHRCYPPGQLIFEAFNACPFDDIATQ